MRVKDRGAMMGDCDMIVDDRRKIDGYEMVDDVCTNGKHVRWESGMVI